MNRSVARLALAPLLGLAGCLIGSPEALDFANDPRILRGSYRGVVDARTSSATIALSADSRLLAMSAGDGLAAVQLWDVQTQTAVKGLGRLPDEAFFSGAADVAISADGARVANLFLDRVQLWDTVTGTERYRLDAGPALGPCSYACLQRLELSARADLLAVAGGDRPRVALYEGEAGALLSVLEAPGSTVEELAMSPGGERLAVLTSDYTDANDNQPFYLQVWSPLDASAPGAAHLAFTGSSRWPQRLALALSADGSTLAFTGDAKVRVIDLQTRAETVLPLPHDTQSLALSPGGEQLAVGHFRPNGRAALKVYEVASGRMLADHDGPASVRWSDDGRFLLVVGAAEPADAGAPHNQIPEDSGAPKLLRADDLATVGHFENGELHRLELEATPTYVTAQHYRVAGTVRVDGGAGAPFSGTVRGSEAQRYLAPRARLPNPAELTLELAGYPWVLHGFQDWEQDETESRPGGVALSHQKLGSWEGYAEIAGETSTAFYPFYLERAE
ncbi:WD40 repeat domain-containing protein [Truepera radiovictrix]|nr:hypothetical protein [Truepera radiovictrix]WMT56107.1 hypothetical protein RCV51_08790 [Truepera radiovictrix]